MKGLRRQICGELFKIDNMERRTWTKGGDKMLGMLHFDIPEKVATSRNENDFAPQDAKTSKNLIFVALVRRELEKTQIFRVFHPRPTVALLTT